MGILRRIKGRVKKQVREFFEIPAKHNLKVGMLVTCTCHGGVAIVLELYDNGVVGYPRMNMARIWWISPPVGNNETRVWMHVINRLMEY